MGVRILIAFVLFVSTTVAQPVRRDSIRATVYGMIGLTPAGTERAPQWIVDQKINSGIVQVSHDFDCYGKVVVVVRDAGYEFAPMPADYDRHDWAQRIVGLKRLPLRYAPEPIDSLYELRGGEAGAEYDPTNEALPRYYWIKDTLKGAGFFTYPKYTLADKTDSFLVAYWGIAPTLPTDTSTVGFNEVFINPLLYWVCAEVEILRGNDDSKWRTLYAATLQLSKVKK